VWSLVSHVLLSPLHCPRHLYLWIMWLNRKLTGLDCIVLSRPNICRFYRNFLFLANFAFLLSYLLICLFTEYYKHICVQACIACLMFILPRYWLDCAIDCDWTVEHFQVFCHHCFTCAINFALYLIHRSIYVALELFAYILCQAFLGFYRRLMLVLECAFSCLLRIIFSYL